MRGTLFRPRSNTPAPAIMVLHTRGGVGIHELTEGAWYASQGFVAYAPDYFSPVGLTSSTFDLNTFGTRYLSTVVDHLARGVECLRGLAGVDRDRVAAVGYSLGGYVGLALAGRPGIRAVAGWYTAFTADKSANGHGFLAIAAGVLVPVLLLHGDADTTVRIDLARSAEASLEIYGKRSQLVVYPGVGHGFDQQLNPQYRYDAAATADSRARTLAHLQSAP